MHRTFEGRSVPDPGTTGRRTVYWVVALVLIGLVTAMQQFNVIAHSTPKPVPTVEPVDPKDVKNPPILHALGDELDQPDIAGRLVVKLAHADPAQNGAQFAQFVAPSQQPELLHAVRVVPAYTELAGTAEGLKEIRTLAERIDASKDLADAEKASLNEDVAALERLYTSGSADLSAADRERIQKRLGWQGRLALSFDLDDTDPARAPMIADGVPLLLFLAFVGLGFVAVVVIGFVVMVIALVMLFTGRIRPRMDRPSPGGSLGIEVVTVFLAGFAGLKILMELVALAALGGWFGDAVKADPEATLTPVALLAQWVILPVVVFYPRLRGYQRFRVKRAIGWHTGEGLFKEIACGVAGYLACVPLYLGAAVVALVLSWIEHEIIKAVTGREPSGPVNPIGGLLAESWWVAVLVAMLATVWAPIVEETVFRGSLFRQLYARLGLAGSALLSAVVFAMMHGYSPSLFPPLIVLGAGFAVIRWWRGSLVPCVTAHALHNGTLMVIMFVLFSLLK